MVISPTHGGRHDPPRCGHFKQVRPHDAPTLDMPPATQHQQSDEGLYAIIQRSSEVLERLLTWMVQVSETLVYIHGQRIVHADPSNMCTGSNTMERRLFREASLQPHHIERYGRYLEARDGRFDYAAQRAQQRCMGSVSVESTCRQLGSRMRRCGQRWKKEGIRAISALRAAYDSRAANNRQLPSMDRWSLIWNRFFLPSAVIFASSRLLCDQAVLHTRWKQVQIAEALDMTNSERWTKTGYIDITYIFTLTRSTCIIYLPKIFII